MVAINLTSQFILMLRAQAQASHGIAFWRLVCYKVREVLLQSATGFTNYGVTIIIHTDKTEKKTACI